MSKNDGNSELSSISVRVLRRSKIHGARYVVGNVEQIVGRERRERVSQLAWCGGGGFDSRRRVNSTVGRLLMILNRFKRRWIFAAALIALALAAFLAWNWFPNSSLSYQLWKRGLNPYVTRGVQRGILSDPQVEQIFLGKTAPDLESMIGNIHPTEGSFDLLVSKNFGGARGPGETWYQWRDQYLIFVLTNGRVTAVRRVHG